MRTKKHYKKLLATNPSASIGFAMAADMVFAARHEIIHRAEAHGTEEWRVIALDLKARYGENLTADEVRAEMVATKEAECHQF